MFGNADTEHFYHSETSIEKFPLEETIGENLCDIRIDKTSYKKQNTQMVKERIDKIHSFKI